MRFIGGVILVSMLGLVGALWSKLLDRPSDGAAASSATAAVKSSEADQLPALIARAESGEAEAIAALHARAHASNSPPALLALGRVYFKSGKIEAGLRAYGVGASKDARFGEAKEVLGDVRRAIDDIPNQDLALRTAAQLGAAGADLLYDVQESARIVNPGLSRQATAVLNGDAREQASPALRVALDLFKAKSLGCAELKKLLPRVLESGDARALPLLLRLDDRRGCGFLGLRDCFVCLRSGSELSDAQKSVAARPAPIIGR